MAFGPGKLFPPDAGVFTGGLAATCAYPEESTTPKSDNASPLRRFPGPFPDGEIIPFPITSQTLSLFPSSNKRNCAKAPKAGAEQTGCRPGPGARSGFQF